MSVYNFTVYDVLKHKAYCYLWSENDAKKGSNEVASCLLHFIELKIAEGISKFSSYSDNCGGQNRNRFVFAMFVFVCAKYNIDIKHTFLEAGHTQNESDSVHSMIERYSSKRKIFTLDEWREIIKAAKETGEKYDVIDVTYNMIYNFKDLAGKQNWNKTVVTKKN